MNNRNSPGNASTLKLGQHVPIEVAGQAAHAWIPAPLTQRDLTLSERTVRLTERAAVLLNETRPNRHHRLLALIEADASSQIEGIFGSIFDAAAAQHHPDSLLPELSRRLLGALRAVTDAENADDSPSVKSLLHWHHLLMSDTNALDPGRIGTWRTQQVWVNGTHPSNAAHVPPPAGHIPDLIDDLVDFCATSPADPITLAAVAHAQFESIHPFTDGNGRVGRALITRLLVRQFGWAPAWSTAVVADRLGYYAALNNFRDSPADEFVAWFAQRTITAVETARDAQSRLNEHPIPERSAARRAYNALLDHVVLTAAEVAEFTGTGERAARATLHQLEADGFVRSREGFPASRGGRPRTLWVDTFSAQLLEP